MTVRYSTGTLNALLGEAGVEAGANGLKGIFKDAIIEIYSGGQPASADAAATGTKLGQVTLGSGAFVEGTATNGLEFDPPTGGELTKAVAELWQFKGLAAGVAGWFRLRANAIDDEAQSIVLPRIDGNIGTTAGDLKLSNVNVVVDGISSIDVFKVKLS